jgi:hypothetical protein
MDDRLAVFLTIGSGFMVVATIVLIILYVMIGNLENKVKMNSIYWKDIDRDLDNLTDYVHNSKDALLDYFNLEIQRTPITVKKRGK